MSVQGHDRRLPGLQLFKYLKPEHVEGAVSRGRFRIGTLHEYRDAEKYPGAQLDRGEGDMILDGVIHGFSSDAGHKPSPILKKVFGPGIGSGGKVTIDRCIIENFHDRTSDLYIFCSSHRFNPAIYSRSEYGAAVRISDGHQFCGALTRRLHALGKIRPTFVDTGPIEYRDRRVGFTEYKGQSETNATVPWHFVKPDNYAEEYEWRFAWEIQSLERNLIIDCPEAAQYVAVIDPTSVCSDPGRAPPPEAG